MDKDVILAKLEMLMRCVERIKSQNIQTLEDLENSLDKQDIILLNLQRAVQVCVDIGNHVIVDFGITPNTMADTFKILAEKNLISKPNAVNLSKAVGFRNIAVHQYEAIDNKIIFAIVKNNLNDFSEFAASVAKF